MKPALRLALSLILLTASLESAAVGGNLQFVDLNGAPKRLEQWYGQNLLVLFWRADCSPCLTEMRMLPELARRNFELPIVLVSLQDASQMRSHLPELPSNVHALAARDDGRTVLTAFGNDRTLALPYSVMLDKHGVVCGQHYGIISPQLVSSWRKQC